MEQIREIFKNKYKKWEIELPQILEDYGVINKAGWHFTYVIEILNTGQKVIHISSDHRMGGPNAYSIYEDGSTESILSGISGFAYDPKIPGDKENKQEIYFAKNRKVGATHRRMGLGRKLKTRDLTTIIEFREYDKEISFSNKSQIYHPNYPSPIKYNQIEYRSLSHFYHYWRFKLLNNKTESEKILEADNHKIDFVNGIVKNKSVFNFFKKNKSENILTNAVWEENKLRILLWGSIMKFDQNQELTNEIVKYFRHRFTFKDDVEYWGSKSNVLGYVLTHTCKDIYYLNWKEPGDNT